jgi:hypothetical protein
LTDPRHAVLRTAAQDELGWFVDKPNNLILSRPRTAVSKDGPEAQLDLNS